MPGLAPGIHGMPTEGQPLLNSRVFSHRARLAWQLHGTKFDHRRMSHC
jgi:hypothetical protein